MKYAYRTIGGVGATGFGILLVLRVYVLQELLAALVLVSIASAAVALLIVTLFLLDALGQALFFRLQTAAEAGAALARRSLAVRRGIAESSLGSNWAEIAPSAIRVTQKLRRGRG